jgi:hypothetical protein
MKGCEVYNNPVFSWETVKHRNVETRNLEATDQKDNVYPALRPQKYSLHVICIDGDVITLCVLLKFAIILHTCSWLQVCAAIHILK